MCSSESFIACKEQLLFRVKSEIDDVDPLNMYKVIYFREKNYSKYCLNPQKTCLVESISSTSFIFSQIKRSTVIIFCNEILDNVDNSEAATGGVL